MEKNKKKKYEKPRMKRVHLDARCAVLGLCKIIGQGGIGVPFCGDGVAPCTTIGS